MSKSEAKREEVLFSKFHSYPFDQDPIFCAGLESIRKTYSTPPPPTVWEERMGQAKAYYFSKRFEEHIDLKRYNNWINAKASMLLGPEDKEKQPCSADSEQKDPSPSPSSLSMVTDQSPPTYPPSFQELCALIAEGKPIPGIRHIPNELAQGTPAAPVLSPPKKPWEKE